MKKRIWELDALRGVCILGMVAVHFVYDLISLFGIMELPPENIFYFLITWGGVLFVMLSGICVTLGSRPVRRGIIVFCGGLLCTAATTLMYLTGMTGISIIIYFGVLHCLGVCMLLWPLFKKAPVWLLGVLGAVLALVGLYLRSYVRVEFDYLAPLGLFSRNFASSDYYPLLPNLGYFLLGAFLGKTLYRNKQTLFPKIPAEAGIIRFFTWWGKWSLPVYLLHQPILTGLVYLITMLL